MLKSKRNFSLFSHKIKIYNCKFEKKNADAEKNFTSADRRIKKKFILILKVNKNSERWEITIRIRLIMLVSSFNVKLFIKILNLMFLEKFMDEEDI